MKHSKLHQITFCAFLCSIFFFRLPDLYIIPGNTVFTTQVIARILIFLVFIFNIVALLFQKKLRSLIENNDKKLILLVVLFFTLQSLSILAAININSFLFRYLKDILPGILIFLTFYFYRSRYKSIALAFVLPIFFNIAFELFMFFDRPDFIAFFRNLIYSRHLSFILYNLNRDRLYIDTYDEAALPMLLFTNFIKVPFLNYLLFSTIAFLSFVSNWRTRILLLFFGLISSFVILKKIKSITFILTCCSVIFFGYIANAILLHYAGFSFVDRISLQDTAGDVDTLSYRTKQIKTSLEMGFATPLGVGLGNYYDNLSSKNKTPLYNRDVQEGTEGSIHNIFAAVIAETGYLSFAILILLLLVFARHDIGILKNGEKYHQSFVICFWTIFVYSILNPNVGGSYLIFFWGLRGLLV